MHHSVQWYFSNILELECSASIVSSLSIVWFLLKTFLSWPLTNSWKVEKAQFFLTPKVKKGFSGRDLLTQTNKHFITSLWLAKRGCIACTDFIFLKRTLRNKIRNNVHHYQPKISAGKTFGIILKISCGFRPPTWRLKKAWDPLTNPLSTYFPLTELRIPLLLLYNIYTCFFVIKYYFLISYTGWTKKLLIYILPPPCWLQNVKCHDGT